MKWVEQIINSIHFSSSITSAIYDGGGVKTCADLFDTGGVEGVPRFGKTCWCDTWTLRGGQYEIYFSRTVSVSRKDDEEEDLILSTEFKTFLDGLSRDEDVCDVESEAQFGDELVDLDDDLLEF